MPTLKIDFDDDDTTPDRLASMAADLEITPEMLIKRAITEYLGEYGLHEPPEDFKPKTIRDLFEGHGLLKPKN